MTPLTRWAEMHGAADRWMQRSPRWHGLPVWNHSRDSSSLHNRARRNAKTESLLLSMMKQPQISHLFQKLDERHPPVRPHSQIHRLPWPALSFSPPHSNSTSCLCVCVCVCAARTQQVTLSLSQTVVLCEVCRNAAPPKSWQLPQKQWGNVWMSEARPNHLLHQREREQENKTAAKWAWSSFYQQVPWFDSHFWLLELPLTWLVYLYFEAHALNCRSEKKTWNYLPQTGSTPDFSTLSSALNPDSNLLQIKRKVLCTAATAAGDGCVKMGVFSLYKSRLYQILPWCLLVSWKASDALAGTSQSSFVYQLHLLSLEIILWCSHHELGFSFQLAHMH